MTVSRFSLCALPAAVWEPGRTGRLGEIARFAADALAAERRMEKGVNLKDEHDRYTLCCHRLEGAIAGSGLLAEAASSDAFAVALTSGRFPVRALAPGYLAVLAGLARENAPRRLAASFYPPDQVPAHLAEFERWVASSSRQEVQAVQERLEFLREAVAHGCGVVELQSLFHAGAGPAVVTPPPVGPEPATSAQPAPVQIPDILAGGTARESLAGSARKRDMARILSRQIVEALQAGEPVSFGNQAPHDVITEVLHSFVFVAPGERPAPTHLRVVYADGSEAEPFPLFVLPTPSSEARIEARPLRAALMSMRHPELDRSIDFCWFRNREVSQTRTLSETDTVCTRLARDQLRDGLVGGDLWLHLYHTGFEPAVLGFYRALTEALRDGGSEPLLAVLPLYYRGGEPYEAGSLWRR